MLTSSTITTDSAEFQTLAAYFQPAASGTGRRRFASPRFAIAAIRFFAKLAARDVALTDTASGRRIRAQLAPSGLTVPRLRLCTAVYDVPVDLAERPSGKRNSRLRTALRAAETDGMTIRPVSDLGERAVLAKQAAMLSPRLSDWAEIGPTMPEEDWWVAEDAHGAPVGIAAAVIDREVAWLVTLIGMEGHPMRSTARYVLHHTVTRLLSERGVRCLGTFDNTPLHTPPGSLHLQRVLGYHIVRLRKPAVLT